MNSQKTLLEQVLNWLKKFPTWLINALTIIGLVAGIVVSFRADKYLYVVISISLVALYTSGVAAYILLKRDPSPFGGKGAFRYYKYHFAAKGILVIVSVSVIFLLSFNQSREYVQYAINGTPTPDYAEDLLIISSSWDRGCADNIVILNDNELPAIQETYHDLSKGDIQKYSDLSSRVSALDWWDGYSTDDNSWKYFGLSLILTDNSNISEAVILKNEIEVSAISIPPSEMTNIISPFLPACGGGGTC